MQRFKNLVHKKIILWRLLLNPWETCMKFWVWSKFIVSYKAYVYQSYCKSLSEWGRLDNKQISGFQHISYVKKYFKLKKKINIVQLSEVHIEVIVFSNKCINTSFLLQFEILSPPPHDVTIMIGVLRNTLFQFL